MQHKMPTLMNFVRLAGAFTDTALEFSTRGGSHVGWKLRRTSEPKAFIVKAENNT